MKNKAALTFFVAYLAISSAPSPGAAASDDFLEKLQEGHDLLLESVRSNTKTAALPQEVQNKARELGRFLRPAIRQATEQVNIWVADGMPLPEAKARAFQNFFGPSLERHASSTEVLYGDVFRLIKSSRADVPADRIGPKNMFSVSGPPALVFSSLDAGNAFFYEPTLIDPQTGRIYQAIYTTGEIYGPLEPPEEAKITGRFNREQAWKLELEIRAGL